MAPTFSARASLAGKEFDFSLQDALKKGPVVVYSYPSAYTKGCDLEAHTFAQEKDKFDAAGATIIGVSGDSVARLDKFSADPEYCAGKFPVASDADRKIANSYNLTMSAAVGPARRMCRAILLARSRLHRTRNVRHRQGSQDHRDVFVKRRQAFARSACGEIAGDRAGAFFPLALPGACEPR